MLRGSHTFVCIRIPKRACYSTQIAEPLPENFRFTSLVCGWEFAFLNKLPSEADVSDWLMSKYQWNLETWSERWGPHSSSQNEVVPWLHLASHPNYIRLKECCGIAGDLEHCREAGTLISSGEISHLAFSPSTIPWLLPVPVIWGTPLRTNYCCCSAQPSTLFGWWEFLFVSCPPYSPGSIKFPLGYMEFHFLFSLVYRGQELWILLDGQLYLAAKKPFFYRAFTWSSAGLNASAPWWQGTCSDGDGYYFEPLAPKFENLLSETFWRIYFL